MKFKEWLIKETPGIQMDKTKFVVFDFDGTIANVPEKPQKHEKKHDWNGKDWWGSEQSLAAPFYDGGVNEEVVNAFKEAKADPSAHVILLTGRRGVVAHSVRDVLRNQGIYGRRMIPDSNQKARSKFDDHLKAQKDVLHPDEANDGGHDEYYSGDHSTESDYPKGKKGKPDGDTMVHKVYTIKRLMHDGFRVVEFWDDRQDHLPHFVRLGQELLKTWPNVEQVWMHRVFPPAFPGATAAVQTIPLHHSS